jgi:hyperosmotically inducible protein
MRFLLFLVVVGLIAAWWLGYVPGRPAPAVAPAARTQAGRTIDPEAARQRGAAVGERMAEGVNRVVERIDDATVTAKIKSKMALDDLVQARDISVQTVEGVVTVSGTVGSDAERQRAMRLAQETAGVRGVTDRLAVRVDHPVSR